MKLFLALPSPQRDQNWDLPVQSATDTQNVAFGPSHPLPANQSGKHTGSARIKSGVAALRNFSPVGVRSRSTTAVSNTSGLGLLCLSDQTLAMRVGMSGSCQNRT